MDRLLRLMVHLTDRHLVLLVQDQAMDLLPTNTNISTGSSMITTMEVVVGTMTARHLGIT